MVLFVTILGLIIGSFLGACVYRIPLPRLDELEAEDETLPRAPRELKGLGISRNDVTINHPKRSFCPSCHATLRWYHNIPVVSWLALRGRCASCKAAISWRYPLIELLSAGCAFFSYNAWGASPTAVAVYALCAALIVISFIDIDYYIIPNVISYPGTAIGVAIALLNEFTGWFLAPVVPGILESLFGIAAGAGTLWVVSEGYFRLRGKDGLGLGDVKLLAVIGALSGWQAAFYTIFVGSVIGSLFGLIAIVALRREASRHIPFGPYLSSAAVLYLFTGDAIVEYWLRFTVMLLPGAALP